jgi:hypothetical protein
MCTSTTGTSTDATASRSATEVCVRSRVEHHAGGAGVAGLVQPVDQRRPRGSTARKRQVERRATTPGAAARLEVGSVSRPVHLGLARPEPVQVRSVQHPDHVPPPRSALPGAHRQLRVGDVVDHHRPRRSPRAARSGGDRPRASCRARSASSSVSNGTRGERPRRDPREQRARLRTPVDQPARAADLGGGEQAVRDRLAVRQRVLAESVSSACARVCPRFRCARSPRSSGSAATTSPSPPRRARSGPGARGRRRVIAAAKARPRRTPRTRLGSPSSPALNSSTPPWRNDAIGSVASVPCRRPPPAAARRRRRGSCPRQVHAGLAAHARVDHRQERRRDLQVGEAAQVGGGREAGQVADHAAAERDHQAARSTRARPGAEHLGVPSRATSKPSPALTVTFSEPQPSASSAAPTAAPCSGATFVVAHDQHTWARGMPRARAKRRRPGPPDRRARVGGLDRDRHAPARRARPHPPSTRPSSPASARQASSFAPRSRRPRPPSRAVGRDGDGGHLVVERAALLHQARMRCSGSPTSSIGRRCRRVRL